MVHALRQIRPFPAIVSLLCGCILLVVAFAYDAEVQSWQKSLDKPLRWAADVVSDFGDWPYLMAGGVALLVLSLHAKFRAIRQVVVCMMLASTLAGALANVLKNTTGRARPNAKHVEQGWHGPVYQNRLTLGNSRLASFPSGHSAAAAGFFGCLLFLRMPVSLLGVLLIWLIPAARIVSGAHFLSDVVAGSILGLLAAAYVHHVLRGSLVARILAFPMLCRRLPGGSSEKRGTA